MLLGTLSAPAQVVYTPTFTATNVNMWGTGSATTVDYSAYHQVEWDASGGFGGIERTIFGDWGLEVFGSSSGHVGVDVGFKSTSGGVDINLPYRVSITPSSSDMSAAGTYTLDVASSLDLDVNESVLTTRFPNAEIALGGRVAAQVTIGGEIAAYASVRGSQTLFDFDTGQFPIFAYNQNGNNAVSIFGGAGIPVGAGITIGLPPGAELQPGDSAVSKTIFSGVPLGIQLGTLTIASPSSALNATSGQGFATHAAQETLFSLQADILGIASAALGLPVNPLDIRAEVAGFGINGRLFSATAGITAGLEQNISLNQSLGMILRSTAPLTYHNPDGSTVTTSEYLVTNVNAQISFDKPSGDVAIFPEFFLLNPRLTTELNLLLGIGFSIEALSVAVSRSGSTLGSLGPVFSYDGVLDIADPTVFENTFDLTRLGSRVFGGSLTNVQAQVGDIAAGEVVLFNQRVGLFATENIDGSLEMSGGSFYQNSGPVTIGAAGTLALAAGDTTTKSTFVSAGALTNLGFVSIGAGSKLEIAGALTNLTDGTLSGGSYFVEGTLKIPVDQALTTNAATLLINGGRLDNDGGAGANGFSALTRNTSAGVLAFGGAQLALAGAFTNEGYLSLNGTGITTPGFTNTATGRVDVFGGVLEITGITGSLTNQGMLNVGTGTEIHLLGGLGNLTNGGHTLTGGTWNLAGRVRFGYHLGYNPDITTIAAGTTVNLFGANSGFVAETYNYDPLTFLNTNHGQLGLYGRSLELPGGLTNSGSIVVTPGADNIANTLRFNGTLANSGSIAIDAGSTLLAPTAQFDTWDSVNANGHLSIGGLILAGQLRYSGPMIQHVVGDLTLVGNAWQIQRAETFLGQVAQTFGNGLALRSITGALHLTQGAHFNTDAGATLSHTGTLDVGADSRFQVSHGLLDISAGATVTNHGEILLQHDGTTPARIELSGAVTFGGTGRLLLSNLATNEVSGALLTNSGSHVIAGSGVISAPLHNLGTIQSVGSAGLTLAGSITNAGLIFAHGETDTSDLADIAYTPSPLTLSNNVIYNTGAGTLFSASTLNLVNVDVYGGRLLNTAGGTIYLSGTDLEDVAFTNAASGRLEIAAGTTNVIDDTVHANSLHNEQGAVLVLGAGARLDLVTSAPLLNDGTITLSDNSLIYDPNHNNVTYQPVVINRGTIRFEGPNQGAFIYTDLINDTDGMMDLDAGNVLRINGNTFTNRGNILLGNSGTLGTLRFNAGTELVGGGTISLGGLVKTTPGGVDTYHWEQSGVVNGFGYLVNVNNTIGGAGLIGDGTLTLVNANDGKIHASAPGGTLTLRPGNFTHGLAGDRTAIGFLNDGLIQVDAGARLLIDTEDGPFQNLIGEDNSYGGYLSGGRYIIAGTLVTDPVAITSMQADVTLLGNGRIEDAYGNDALANFDFNAGTLRLQQGASLNTYDDLFHVGSLVLGGDGDLAGGTLTARGVVGDGDVSLADATAHLVFFTPFGRETGLSGVVSGPGHVTFTGSGTQLLLADNTYSGGTLIDSVATAHPKSNTALGTGTITWKGKLHSDTPAGITLANNFIIADHATAATGFASSPGSGDLTIAGVVSGGGLFTSLTKTGYGKLTLTGANTYNSPTQLNEGTLSLGHDSAAGVGLIRFRRGTLEAGGGARTIANNLFLEDNEFGYWSIGGEHDLTLTGQVTGDASWQKIGSGRLTLSGSNGFPSMDLSNGTLEIAHDYALGTGTFFVSGGTVVTAASHTIQNRVVLSNSATFGGTHDLTLATGGGYGSGSFTKTGPGQLTISSANDWTGAIRLESGTLAVGATQALGSGTLTLAGGVLTASANGAALGNAVTLDGGATIGGAHDLALSGLIGGDASATLTKTGSGRLTLSGANDYAGTTTITGGTIEFNSAASFGTGTLTLNGGSLRWASGTSTDLSSRLAAFGANGATFDTNGNDVAFASVLTGTGALLKTGGGVLSLNGSNTYAGGTVVTGGLLEFSSLGNLGSGNLTIDGGGVRWGAGTSTDLSSRLNALGAGGATFDTQGNNVTFNSVLSGLGGLTKTGAGTLALTAANTYSGPTAVTGGALQIGADTALGNSAATLQLNGGSLQLAADLTLSRTITLGASGGAFDTNGHALTLTTALSGAGSLSKSGSGTLSLAVANDHTGGTTLAAGTLAIHHDQALGQGVLTLAGGTLQSAGTGRTVANAVVLANPATIEATSSLTLTGGVSGTGGLTKIGAETLTLSGTNAYTGGTTVIAGTLTGSTSSLIGNITNQANVTFNQPADGDYSGVMSGSGSLTKSGEGSLTLLGANSHAGGTTLSAGTLVAGHDSSFGTGALTLAGGTLGTNGPRSLANAITVTGPSTIHADDRLDLTGTLSGSGALTKDGSGLLAVGPASTRTGSTTLAGGTFAAGHDQAFGSGVITFAGGSLQADGAARTIANDIILNATAGLAGTEILTLSGAIGGDHGLSMTSGGTLVLTGSNTFAGTTNVANSTLEFSSLTNLGTGRLSLDNATLRWAAGATTDISSRLNQLGFSGVTFDTNGNDVTLGTSLTSRLSIYSGLTKQGAGTLTLTAAHDFGGRLTVAGGAVALGGDGVVSGDNIILSGGALYAVGAGRQFNGSVTLETDSLMGGDQDLNLTGQISSAANDRLIKVGTGKLTLSNGLTHAGGTRLEAGTLVGAFGYSFGSGHLDLAGGELRLGSLAGNVANSILLSGPAAIGGGIDMNLTGVVSGAPDGVLTKTGTNSLTLSNINTYTGRTILQSGTLVAASDGALGSGTLVLAGGTFQGDGNARTLHNAVEVGANGIAFGGTSDLTFTGQLINRSSSDVTLEFANINSLSFGGAVLSDSATSYTLTMDGAGSLAFTGPIENGGTSTAGALVKTGTGTLVLTGANTYGGGTTLRNGLLALGHDSALGTGTFVINGGALRADGTARTFANALTLGSDITYSGPASLTFTGAFTHDTSLAASHTLTFNNAGASAFSGAIALSTTATAGQLTFASDQALALSGIISDGTTAGGRLIKTGSGTLTLGNFNTFSGGTTITGGLATFGAAASFGTGDLTLDGGGVRWASGLTLDLSDRLTALGAGGGTFDTHGNDIIFGTSLTGSGGLVKDGLGTLRLASSNAYSGDTTVLGGTLEFDTLASLGSGQLTMNGGTLAWLGLVTDFSDRLTALGAGGATFDFGGQNVTLATPISGTGGITRVGGGNLTLTATNTFGGGVTLLGGGVLTVAADANLGASGGALTLESATVRLTAPITVDRPTTLLGTGLTFDTTADAWNAHWLGDIDGSGSLTKTGDGTLTLHGTGTYSGPTYLNGGSLVVSSDSQLGAGDQGLIFNGGRLGTGGTFTTDRTLALNANAHITLNSPTPARFNNTISGAGSLTLTGNGIAVLGGNNTYAGGTILGYNAFAEFSSGANFSSGAITSDGGGLRWAEGSTTDISARVGPLGQSGLYLDTNGNNVTLAGNFSSAAGVDDTLNSRLIKRGEGTLTLTGTNTQIAGTAVQGGTLIAADTALGAVGAKLELATGGTFLTTTNSVYSRPLAGTGGSLDVSEGVTTTWNGAFTGTLMKGGAGTLQLGSAVDEVQFASVNAGTLISAEGTSFFGVEVNGGTFVSAANNSFYYAPTINAGGTFRAGAADAVGLSAPTIAAGGLFDANGFTQDLYSFTGAGTFNVAAAGARFRISYQFFDGRVTGAGGVTFYGPGFVNVRSVGAFDTPLTIEGTWDGAPDTTLQLGVDHALKANVPVTVNHGAQLVIGERTTSIGALGGNGLVLLNVHNSLAPGHLTIDQSTDSSFTGLIKGYGHLVKAGAGTLTLAPNQEFRGSTTLAGGTLAISAESALGLDLQSNLTFDGGTLQTTASMSIGTRFAPNYLRLDAGGGTFSPDAATTLSYAGVIDGTGRLTKSGAGTLALSGTNTYTGGTTITAGTLQLQGAVTGDIINEGLLHLTRNGMILANNISGSGNLLKGAGSATLTGTNTYTGLTTVQGQTLQIGDGATSGSIVSNVALTGPNPTLRFNRSDDVTYAGVISTPGGSTNLSTGVFTPQTGSLSKRGAGTLTLTGVNTFLGTTTVEAGALSIGADSGLGTAPATATAGRLVLNGGALHTTATFALDAHRGITLGAGGGTLSTSTGTTLTYEGIVAGSGALTKSGGGTLVMTGVSSFTGSTSISAGRLELDGSAVESAFTVNGGILTGHGTTGTLTIASGGTFSPGDSPGTLNAGATTWAGGGSYLWEINDATGTAGADPGWDLLNITGALTVTATAESRFNIDLTSLTLANVSGQVANFDPNQNGSYTIATASGGISGFEVAYFNLNTSPFANELAGGAWSIAQSGNNVNLVFTAAAIPEPSTYAALAGLGAFAVALLRRRRIVH